MKAFLCGCAALSVALLGFLAGLSVNQRSISTPAAREVSPRERYSLFEYKDRELDEMVGAVNYQLLRIDHATGQVWRLTNAKVAPLPGGKQGDMISAEGWAPIQESFSNEVQQLQAKFGTFETPIPKAKPVGTP